MYSHRPPAASVLPPHYNHTGMMLLALSLAQQELAKKLSEHERRITEFEKATQALLHRVLELEVLLTEVEDVAMANQDSAAPLPLEDYLGEDYRRTE